MGHILLCSHPCRLPEISEVSLERCFVWFSSGSDGPCPNSPNFHEYLHDLGHVLTSFIDNSLLVGEMVEEVCKNVKDTIKIVDSLGFSHDKKSQLSPSQEITCLGFVLNSTSMTITLMEEQKRKIYHVC